MGNCLLLQASAVVKITETDGKVIEYKTHIEAQQAVSQYSGHLLSHSLPVLQKRQQRTRRLGGQSYYLVPQAPKSSQKKKVRFSNPEVESDKKSGVVRVKLVISKQQLHEMLQNGRISVEGLVIPQLESKEETVAANILQSSDECQVWKPVLESIPEADF